jgi:ABC-type Fe2+-enterobactin transport system substrate-binding protein
VIVTAPNDVSWYQKTLDTFLGFVTGDSDQEVGDGPGDFVADNSASGGDSGLLSEIATLKAEIEALKNATPPAEPEAKTPPKVDYPDVATAPDTSGESELIQFQRLHAVNPRQALDFYKQNAQSIAKQLGQAFQAN